MKRMKIALVAVLVVATAAAAFAAGTKEEGPTTLRFMWWGGESRHTATLASIALFQKKFPAVKVDAEYMGWEGYYDKLVTQVAGGSAADVIQSDYKFFPQLVAQGGVYMDLGKVKDVIDMTGFEDAFLKKWCVYDGKLLGLPTGLNAQNAIINKTLMEKQGITWQRSWTWDMILDEGKKLHAKDPNAFFLVQGPENLVYQVLMPYLMQLTGTNLIQDAYTISFTKDDLAKGFDYIKRLLDAGALLPLDQSAMFGVNIPENPKWVNGQAAMYLNFTTHIVTAKDAAKGQVITTQRLPIMNGAKQSGILVTPAQLLSINQKTKSPKSAAAFINFFFNDRDSVLILKMERSVPAVAKAREALSAAGLMDADLAEAVSVGAKNVGLSIGGLLNHTEVSKILQNGVELVGYGKAAPADAADVTLKALVAKLAELKAAQ
jgi:oligogalacturonide transport system substrate-binding protein